MQCSFGDTRDITRPPPWGRAFSVFTASAWSEQVLSGAGRRDEGLSASTRDDVEASHSDYPREAADSLVRRLPFGGLGALAARTLGPPMTIQWVR
jgi:hypothetical protein